MEFYETVEQDTDTMKLELPDCIEIDIIEVMFANKLDAVLGHKNQQEILRLRWTAISLVSVSAKLAGDEVTAFQCRCFKNAVREVVTRWETDPKEQAEYCKAARKRVLCLMEPVLRWGKKDLVAEVSGPIGILHNAFTIVAKDPKKTIAAVKSIETSGYEVLKDFHASSEGKIIMRAIIVE